MIKENNTLKNATPLITVAMPIYNAGKYLRPAVLSIVQQTFMDWELYIIDDGSTDDALSYIADIQDSRIKVIKDGLNKGLAARLNEVINLAKGRYFARMDQDDIAYPDRFEKQIKALVENVNLDLLATRAIKITMEDRPVGYLPHAFSHAEITSAPWRGFYMPHPTWMGRLQWFKKHHYAETAPYLCEDQELLLRAHDESNFACLPDICLAYRVRDKTSLRKLLKIRYQQMCVQLNYTFNKRLIKFSVFAIYFFILKALNDCYSAIFRQKYAPHVPSDIAETDLTIFKQLLIDFK